MIFDRQLNDAERRQSVVNLYWFSSVNGFAYACVGETMMQLLAVSINAPDAAIAAIGIFLYVGFICLPLGKSTAARIGAARCEGWFWMLRNAFALLLASSAFIARAGHAAAATVVLLIGGFGFYGCRAAANVMQNPLIGEFARPGERSRIIGNTNGQFWSTGLAAYALIAFLMARCESTWTLVCIIAAGSCIGVWSSIYLMRIHETENLRRSARKPVLPDVRRLLADRGFRHLLYAGSSLNLAAMLILPATVIMLKKGFGVSDGAAVLWGLVRSAGAAAGGFATGPLGRRFGPRKEMIWSMAAMFVIAACWGVLPYDAPRSALYAAWFALLLVDGLARVTFEGALQHYFIAKTDAELRFSGSIALFTIMGAVAGSVGLVISKVLFGIAGRGGATAAPGAAAVSAYHVYFLMLFAFLPLIAFVIRLVPLPEELRALARARRPG